MATPGRLHWLRALLFGVLAEVCTILTVVVVVYGHRLTGGAQSEQQLEEFGLRAAAVVGPVFGVIYTFLMALLVVRRVGGRYLAHALLVAAGAIALHLLGVLGAPGGFRAVYVYSDLLKLVAGAVGAFVGGRRSVVVARA